MFLAREMTSVADKGDERILRMKKALNESLFHIGTGHLEHWYASQGSRFLLQVKRHCAASRGETE